MKALFSRLWPRSLAGRLVLLLVAALAAAQLALVLMLGGQQDLVVEQIAHGQALNQTVTLARLLSVYPAVDGEKLSHAFDSKQSCARISQTPPDFERSMTLAEQNLADLLTVMLHGVQAGAPKVSIEGVGPYRRPCNDGRQRFVGAGEQGHDAPSQETPFAAEHERIAAVAMTVPLADGRWLTMRFGVNAPDRWTRATLLSFLISSLAVALAAILSVRAQTRSLRALADASERFGRGEAVAPLSTEAPSEVAAASLAFNTMQERLSQFIRDRLRLLAGVSHDLRTPLTTLRLKSEFVEDEAVRDGLIATIDELAEICEATLAFSRAEETSEATRTVDLRELVTEVAEPFIEAGGDVAIAPSQPLAYPCRPVAFKRALRNLIENALRYGDRASVALERRDGAALLTVEDNGPGLPPDRIEDAFKPFVRLEPSRSAETGGIGLGLAIARSIVQAHGGALTLANLPQGGLRAEIRLPPQHVT